MDQYRHREWRHPNRLHLSIRIDKRVDLDSELASLWRLEPPSIIPTLDEAFNEEGELKRETQAFVLVSLQTQRNQAFIFRIQSGRDHAISEMFIGIW